MLVKDKAFDKAFAQVITLEFKVKKTTEEIKNGGVGGIDLEQLNGIKENLESELDIWNYILSLIEINDKL